VRFAGTYGSPGHRRQRYKCWPRNGDAPHRFTETLPRQNTHSGDCYECERSFAAHEGPPTPRLYEFTAREIAVALVRVGEGQSYRSAAANIRERANRTPGRGPHRRRRLRHGQLVADWVEVFAPVVFERFRLDIEERYARVMAGEGTLLLDALPFHIKGRVRRQGCVRVFSVYAAMSYTGREAADLLKLQAFHGTRTNVTAEWEQFLRSLPGEPQRVVCDFDKDILRAVRRVWPAAEVYVCEWHLKERLRKILEENGVWGSRHEDDDRQVLGVRRVRAAVNHAFASTYGWDTFGELAHRLRIRQLDRWVANRDALIRDQLTRRPLGYRQQLGMAVTTGPLEQKLRVLRERLRERRFSFRNRTRMDRLLMLLQLELDGYSSEQVYAAAIRDWLLSNGGRPRLPRRAIADPNGASSLRAP
jgi:hypothetical protein